MADDGTKMGEKRLLGPILPSQMASGAYTFYGVIVAVIKGIP